MNAYEEMKKRHQAAVDDLPIYWAFTQDSFVQILNKLELTEDDTDQLCKIGGGFCLKTDAERIVKTLRRNREELEAAVAADTTGDGFIEEMFLYELRNHEYTYTLDTEETVNACGFTEAEVEADPRLKHGLEAACKKLREAEGFSF